MAKYERELSGDFRSVLQRCESVIMDGSISASYEDGSDFSWDGMQVAVRVYERYSAFGGNRVSLNLTLVGNDTHVFLTAITAGGSQAVLFKLNTIGEETFLDTLIAGIRRYYPEL